MNAERAIHFYCNPPYLLGGKALIGIESFVEMQQHPEICQQFENFIERRKQRLQLLQRLQQFLKDKIVLEEDNPMCCGRASQKLLDLYKDVEEEINLEEVTK